MERLESGLVEFSLILKRVYLLHVAYKIKDIVSRAISHLVARARDYVLYRFRYVSFFSKGKTTSVRTRHDSRRIRLPTALMSLLPVFFDLATVVKPAYFLFLKRVPVVVSKSGMVYSVSALLATRLFLSLRHQRFRQQPRWLSLRNRQTSSSARKARRAGV